MWEGDNLQLYPRRDLLFDLQHGFERGQRRVGNINVGTNKLDAVGDLPF